MIKQFENYKKNLIFYLFQVMRSVVVGMGAICLALVVVVQKMGTVLQLTMSLEAITNGPLLGIFTIGVLLPWIGSTVKRTHFFLC